jgi:ABC-type enterochelin transport system permease subunit
LGEERECYRAKAKSSKVSYGELTTKIAIAGITVVVASVQVLLVKVGQVPYVPGVVIPDVWTLPDVTGASAEAPRVSVAKAPVAGKVLNFTVASLVCIHFHILVGPTICVELIGTDLAPVVVLRKSALFIIKVPGLPAESLYKAN